MLMTDSIINKNQEHCLCQCHFPNHFYCPMDCCCPCLFFLHESSPNLKSKYNHFNESHRLLIPKKEKELFLKSEKNIEKATPKTPNKKKAPVYFNKLNTHYALKSDNMNSINIKTNIEDNIKNVPKQNNESKNQKTKNININNDDFSNFKKIKVNKNKKDRATTCPASKLPIRKIKKIDLNNCIPFIHNKKAKGKYINNYEINNNHKPKNKEIVFINKKTIDNIRYNNNKYNLTNIFEDNKKKLTSAITNKLKMEDLSDDIFELKQNYSTVESKENNFGLQNLKKDIEKYKLIIKNLNIENETLKFRLFEKEQSNNFNKNTIKVDKSTNTLNHNENEKGKQYTIQKNIFEKEIINLKNEISEITFKLNEYENFISLLKKRNNEQEKIINNKDKEISELMDKLAKIENENNNKLNEFYTKKFEIIKEKEDISNDYKVNNNNLRNEINKLNEILLNKDKKIKELEIRLKYDKKFDNKKQEILELLFQFYIKVKKIINYDKSKESSFT